MWKYEPIFCCWYLGNILCVSILVTDKSEGFHSNFSYLKWNEKLKFQSYAHTSPFFYLVHCCVCVCISVYVYGCDGVCYFIVPFSPFLSQSSKNRRASRVYIIYLDVSLTSSFVCYFSFGRHEWLSLTSVCETSKQLLSGGEHFEIWQGSTFFSYLR